MLKNQTLSDSILQHCTESMDRALLAERHPLWAHSCHELTDIDFVRLGLLRCISTEDSGRHFLQTNEAIHGQLLPHSTYFKSLKSSRRTRMLEAFERQSYQLHCELLLSQRGKVSGLAFCYSRGKVSGLAFCYSYRSSTSSSKY